MFTKFQFGPKKQADTQYSSWEVSRLTVATKQRLVTEAEKNFATLQAEVRKMLAISANEKWEGELEEEKKASDENMREDFEKKLLNELRAKIKDEVRKELLAGLGGTS